MSCTLSLLPTLDSATPHLLTWHAFIVCLAPVLCYDITAVLVILPRTLPIRLALLPITLYSTVVAAVQVYLAIGHADYKDRLYCNLSSALVQAVTLIATRSSIWTFQFEPYYRLKHSSENTFIDALDLCLNFRGLGWSWSTGLKVPKETRDTSTISSFLLSTLGSLVVHFLLFDFTLCVQQLILSSEPKNASIFSPSLAPLLRYARSSLITSLFLFEIYTSLVTVYHLFTLLALCFPILALRSTPGQWPPLFERPWLATSLGNFWGYQWHQLIRHQALVLGGLPFYYLFGRMGRVIGAFLVSGVYHQLLLWAVSGETNFYNVVGFFLINGVGTVAEYAFKRITGYRVGGFGGWVWTMAWCFISGSVIVNAFVMRGLEGNLFMPPGLRPSVVLVGLLNDYGKSLDKF